MLLFILVLQAELDSSLAEAKELVELKGMLKLVEMKLMESRKMVEEQKLQNETKIEELQLKVHISPASIHVVCI